MTIIDPQPTHIDAFDERGVHVGSAQRLASGWWVRFKGRSWWRKTQEQAEKALRSQVGAVTFKESDGKK